MGSKVSCSTPSPGITSLPNFFPVNFCVYFVLVFFLSLEHRLCGSEVTACPRSALSLMPRTAGHKRDARESRLSLRAASWAGFAQRARRVRSKPPRNEEEGTERALTQIMVRLLPPTIQRRGCPSLKTDPCRGGRFGPSGCCWSCGLLQPYPWDVIPKAASSQYALSLSKRHQESPAPHSTLSTKICQNSTDKVRALETDRSAVAGNRLR